MVTLILLAALGLVDKVVEAGETLTLSQTYVLSGNDTLEIRGSADQRCTILGNGNQILTQRGWRGRVSIVNCDIRGLGTPSLHAVELEASGGADIRFDRCTFDASSSVYLRTEQESTARVTNCIVLPNSIVRVDKAREKSRPAFIAAGKSDKAKVFQGNRLYKSSVEIEAPAWLVGGNADAESNLLIGWRAGIFASGEGTVVKGNYIHVLMPRTEEFPWWSQVASFTTSKGALAEHNVIRDGEWIVQFVEGEFRYNVICDINDHNFLRNGSTGRIHHNIFFAGKPEHPPGSQGGCIFVVYEPKPGEQGVEVFNNVFDANNALNVPGIEVNPKGFVKSLRNNAFVRFAHQEKFGNTGQAMIRPHFSEPLTTPLPERLGYSDFNLYHSPAAKSHRVYGLGVAGKAEKDDGFGKHDLVEVDPKFKGPLPDVFPFDDADIKAGKVTVSQMLARFREMYSPAADSPLLGAGDPADGSGTPIGPSK
jgi:hypothetical protein